LCTRCEQEKKIGREHLFAEKKNQLYRRKHTNHKIMPKTSKKKHQTKTTQKKKTHLLLYLPAIFLYTIEIVALWPAGVIL